MLSFSEFLPTSQGSCTDVQKVMAHTQEAITNCSVTPCHQAEDTAQRVGYLLYTLRNLHSGAQDSHQK